VRDWDYMLTPRPPRKLGGGTRTRSEMSAYRTLFVSHLTNMFVNLHTSCGSPPQQKKERRESKKPRAQGVEENANKKFIAALFGGERRSNLFRDAECQIANRNGETSSSTSARKILECGWAGHRCREIKQGLAR